MTALPEGPVLDVDEHGRRVVLQAGDRISLKLDGLNGVLRALGAATPIPVDPDGGITLDEAGEYRYRLVGRDRWDRDTTTYQRVAA